MFTYTPSLVFMARAGYAVVLPQYRGSTGFGQDFVRALPGKCGQLDVRCE